MKAELWHGDIIEDPEFANLLPIVGDDAALRQDLAEHGQQNPLIVWRETGILIDGYRRNRVLADLDVRPNAVAYSFPSKLAAMEWMLSNQGSRRNWRSAFEKVETALKLEPKYVEEARERMSEGGKGVSEVDTPSGKVRDLIAQKAGVSTGSVTKVKALIEYHGKHSLESLRTGEKSIDRGYREMKLAEYCRIHGKEKVNGDYTRGDISLTKAEALMKEDIKERAKVRKAPTIGVTPKAAEEKMDKKLTETFGETGKEPLIVEPALPEITEPASTEPVEITDDTLCEILTGPLKTRNPRLYQKVRSAAKRILGE